MSVGKYIPLGMRPLADVSARPFDVTQTSGSRHTLHFGEGLCVRFSVKDTHKAAGANALVNFSRRYFVRFSYKVSLHHLIIKYH